MSELKNSSTILLLCCTSLPRPGAGPGLQPAQGGVEVCVGGVGVDDLAGLGLADVGDGHHLARLHRLVPPPLPPRLPHQVQLVTNIILQHCNGSGDKNAFF